MNKISKGTKNEIIKKITIGQLENTLKFGTKIGEISRKSLLLFISGKFDKDKVIKTITDYTKTTINYIIGGEQEQKENKEYTLIIPIENVSENIWENTLNFGNHIGEEARILLIDLLKGENNNADNIIIHITKEMGFAISNILLAMGKNPHLDKIEDSK